MAMEDLADKKKALEHDGFAIIENVFNEEEITAFIEVIDKADTAKATFRKTGGLFAIRQFLKELPNIKPYVFTNKLKLIINTVCGDGFLW